MTIEISNRPIAQGDIIIIPISDIPATAKAAQSENGYFIIAHSETGHHHVIEKVRADVFEAADDDFIAYIRTLGDGADIEHKRSFDTHETISLEPNRTYEVRRQREYVPEGFRKAAD